MFLNCTTAEDILKSIKDKNVQMIDLRFTDLPGTLDLLEPADRRPVKADALAPAHRRPRRLRGRRS